MKIRGLFVAASLFFVSANVAQAQNASQAFRVVVPSSLAIVAPAGQILTHDQTDSNQTFGRQRWTVKGNVSNGVAVSFAANTPFVHETNAAMRRDAQLGLELAGSNGPATWTVTTPTDATNIGSSDNDARVAASSNGVGKANFDLTVTFVTGEFGTFASGNYNLTIVGTVAAN
jgi:hypothetical protein